MQTLQIGILTVSDRCTAGSAVDASTPALIDTIHEGNILHGKVVCRATCSDDEVKIQEVLREWCDLERLDVIFTIGGTGVAPRDVTPEAVKKIVSKELPGMSLTMLNESLKITPLAMLSRPICGIRNDTLIITFPGSVKGCVQCLSFVAPALNHAVDLIKDRKDKIDKTHSDLRCTTDVDQPSKVQLPKISMRNRVSPYEMVSVEKALNTILEQVTKAEPIKKCPLDCLNAVVADDVYATENVPQYSTSKVDGYAVKCSDGVGHKKVLGSHVAGGKITSVTRIKNGFCLRVSTGALVPSDAEAVVPVEDTDLISETLDGQEEDIINVKSQSKPLQHVREIGCDMRKAELLLTPGTVISPADIGIIVTSGNDAVYVHPKPRIAIISTGNELQDYKERPLKEGYIYDCNRPTLMSLFEKYASEIYDAGIAPDNPTELRAALHRAFVKADIVITTGGVSMGERDILKPVLEADFNANILFGRVCMKPGKPTTFATCLFNDSKKFIFGLPGNPVSAVVTATLFALPLCRKFSGLSNFYGTKIKVKLSDDNKLDDIRWEYRRVKLDWKSNIPEAMSTGIQESSRLMSMSTASALLILPPRSADRHMFKAGDEVDALLLDF